MTSLLRCSPVGGGGGGGGGAGSTDGESSDLEAATGDALLVLEATAERLLAAGDAESDLSPDGARRLREVGEELSVHALALRMLTSSGLSAERLQPLLERATALVDDEWEQDLRLVESSTR
jgi:hypothetical protein